MRTSIAGAAIVVASLFADNAHAQTVIPNGVIANDTINVTTLHVGKGNNFVFITEKNDTLHLWHTSKPDTLVNRIPVITVFKNNANGYETKGDIYIDIDDKVYAAQHLSGAQTLMFEKKTNVKTARLTHGHKSDCGPRFYTFK